VQTSEVVAIERHPVSFLVTTSRLAIASRVTTASRTFDKP